MSVFHLLNEVICLSTASVLSPCYLVQVDRVGGSTPLKCVIAPNDHQPLLFMVKVLDQFLNQRQFLLLSQLYLFTHTGTPLSNIIITTHHKSLKVYSYPPPHTRASVMHNKMKVANKFSIDLRVQQPKRTASSAKFIRASSKTKPESTVCMGRAQSTRGIERRGSKKLNNFVASIDIEDKLFRAGKSQQMKKKKSAPPGPCRNADQTLLMKKSDRSRILYWSIEPELSQLEVIVVSADFIIDQDRFWQSKGEEQSMEGSRTTRTYDSNPNQSGQSSYGSPFEKSWRYIHRHYFVVWTIRRKNTWRKMQRFISQNSLPLHALVQIKPRRNYAYDLTPVCREISKMKARKDNQNNPDNGEVREEGELAVFEAVKINTKDVAGFDSYQGKVPIVMGKKVKVGLLRVDGQPPGLDPILTALEQWRPVKIQRLPSSCKLIPMRPRTPLLGRRKQMTLDRLTSIPLFLQRHMESKRKEEIVNSRFKRSYNADWQYQEEQVQVKVEQMRRRIIDQMIQQNGRGYTFEGGCSIYNFVGGMLKRNYKIMLGCVLEEMGLQYRVKRQESTFEEAKESNIDLQVEYFEMNMH